MMLTNFRPLYIIRLSVLSLRTVYQFAGRTAAYALSRTEKLNACLAIMKRNTMVRTLRFEEKSIPTLTVRLEASCGF